MRENTDQKNSEYGHFLRSVALNLWKKLHAQDYCLLQQFSFTEVLYVFVFEIIFFKKFEFVNGGRLWESPGSTELGDIHENTIIKFFINRIENLQSKITNVQEKNKHFKSEVKAIQESIEFQNETYEKMKKDMMEEKEKLKSNYRNSKKMQNLIQQNTEINEQIPELEDRHRRNNL